MPPPHEEFGLTMGGNTSSLWGRESRDRLGTQGSSKVGLGWVRTDVQKLKLYERACFPKSSARNALAHENDTIAWMARLHISFDSSRCHAKLNHGLSSLNEGVWKDSYVDEGDEEKHGGRDRLS